jgi:C4-dicarboxylate transporter DctM subunit
MRRMAGAAPSAKPAPFLKPLDLADRGLLLAESSLSVVIVMVMVLMGVAQTIGSIFQVQHPFLRAATDVLMHGTVWAAFLGASFATRGRKHLAIDAVGRLLPDRVRRVMVAVSSTLGSVVAILLAYGVYTALIEQAHAAAEQLANNAESGIQGAVVDHAYEFQFMIPAGFALIAIRLALHGFHEFYAAIAGAAPAAMPPPAPAVDPKARHEEPDGGVHTDPKDPDRVAPFEQAGLVEIAVALVVLIVPILVAIGTTTFIPVVLGVVATMATIGIPLALRWRKTKSANATDQLPREYAKFNVVTIALATVGLLAVYGFAALGIMYVEDVPMSVGIGFFALMALAGAPLFTFLGGLALFLWSHGTETVMPTPLGSAVEDVLGTHFARMSVLPTIPIFTLAGYLMSEAKTAQRLVRLARAFLGVLPGGLAIVCVLASAGFTVFSGASGITIVAIGGLLLPALLKDRYPERFSLGLVTSGGALGITFFPCLPLIVYAIVAGLQETPPGVERVEFDKMIRAGIIPGVIVLALMVGYGFVVGVVSKVPRQKFDFKEAGKALWGAIWEIVGIPIVVLIGMKFSGPLGAAALTAFYVFIVEVFIYKDLSLTKDIPRIIPDSMVLVGAIFVKLCAATVLTFFFVDAQTADALFEVMTCGEPAEQYLAQHADSLGTCREAVAALMADGRSSGGFIDNKFMFLLVLNFFLLIVGMLMDIFSAIVVIVPLVMGIAIAFGINPYHLGIIFLINLEIGYLMPPMGLNLFIAGFRFGRPVPDLYRTVVPFILVFIVALLLTTYIPIVFPDFQNEFLLHPEPPAPIAQPGDGGDTDEPTGPPEDCDVPRDGETYEDFEIRCAEPLPEDCDVPRDGESMDAFMERCPM